VPRDPSVSNDCRSRAVALGSGGETPSASTVIDISGFKRVDEFEIVALNTVLIARADGHDGGAASTPMFDAPEFHALGAVGLARPDQMRRPATNPVQAPSKAKGVCSLSIRMSDEILEFCVAKYHVFRQAQCIRRSRGRGRCGGYSSCVEKCIAAGQGVRLWAR